MKASAGEMFDLDLLSHSQSYACVIADAGEAWMKISADGKLLMLDNALLRAAGALMVERGGTAYIYAQGVIALLDAVAEMLGDAKDDNGDLYSERVLKLEIWDD